MRYFIKISHSCGFSSWIQRRRVRSLFRTCLPHGFFRDLHLLSEIQNVNPNMKTLVKASTYAYSNNSIPLKEEDNNEKRKDRNFESRVSPNCNKYSYRTHTCGELTDSDIGKSVRLMGWIESQRMDRFILLRDGYGETQVILPKERNDLVNVFQNLTLESVILIDGIVSLRPPGQENFKQKTGLIEVNATNLKVFNLAKKLPIYVKNFNKSNESHRLKYRYLDLRHERMQYNLRLRSKIIHKMRKFLIENLNFVEVETPTLFKKTPGGAQEFIVPTEEKEKFYSLVQSPQQLKQLLMIGCIDRYFQVAHCYRDESCRQDRQPEFTQLDIEMSFCDRKDILNLIEDLLKYCWPEESNPICTPFPTLTYNEAMNTYGTDKPDLRFGWKLKNLTRLFSEPKDEWRGKYNIDKFLSEDNFSAFAFVCHKEDTDLSREAKKTFIDQVKVDYPDVGFLILPVKTLTKVEDTLEYLFSSVISLEIKKITAYQPGDVLFMAFGTEQNVLKSLGEVRTKFADFLEENKINVREKNSFNFLWVIDFPLFEKNDDGITSAHHPFTQPHPDDICLLESNPFNVKSLHYDLVLNGHEVGGGSIRIHDYQLQKAVLDILKIDPEPLYYLIEGLASGAPPHGGIALGLDRLIAILCHADSIRDVMAFPKGSSGKDFMTGAPCEISNEDKKRYNIA